MLEKKDEDKDKTVAKEIFRRYDLPFEISEDHFSITVRKEYGSIQYLRECQNEKVEKFFLAEDVSLMLAPVEPLNTPKELAQYLQVEFETPMTIAPKVLKIIYVTFPLEIAVFLTGKDNAASLEAIDIFSMSQQKFTLYGDPSNGLLCKHHKSRIFTAIPEIDMYKEGVIEIEIKNATTEWVTVRKVVFNAYRMKIYYDSENVSMSASMNIVSENMAVTDFNDAPIKQGMTKAPELFVLKKLPIMASRFLMEHGL